MTYTTYGRQHGSCGHEHKTLGDADRCCRKHHKQQPYSDRTVWRCIGKQNFQGCELELELLTANEYLALCKERKGNGKGKTKHPQDVAQRKRR